MQREVQIVDDRAVRDDIRGRIHPRQRRTKRLDGTLHVHAHAPDFVQRGHRRFELVDDNQIGHRVRGVDVDPVHLEANRAREAHASPTLLGRWWGIDGIAVRVGPLERLRAVDDDRLEERGGGDHRVSWDRGARGIIPVQKVLPQERRGAGGDGGGHGRARE